MQLLCLKPLEKVEFSIEESDEEEYKKAQEDDSFDYSTLDEAEVIKLGDVLELNFDAADDEFEVEEFIFTAEEDMKIVIFSTNSVDACVYISDENGEVFFFGDEIFTAVITNKSIDLFESSDFAVKGTVSKGETIRLSVGSYAEENDSFTFSIVKAEDYKELF